MHSDSYFHLWRDTAHFADNPMGVHWTGIVFGLGFAISFATGPPTSWSSSGCWLPATSGPRAWRRLSARSSKMAVPFIVILPGLLGLVLLQNPDGRRMQLIPQDTWKACVPISPDCAPLLKQTSLSPAVQQDVLRTERGPQSDLHSYNEVLPLMMVRYLGPGLLGLGITALIAGFMRHGRQRERLLHRLDLRPLQAAHQQESLRQPLRGVGRLSIVFGVLVSIGAAIW